MSMIENVTAALAQLNDAEPVPVAVEMSAALYKQLLARRDRAVILPSRRNPPTLANLQLRVMPNVPDDHYWLILSDGSRQPLTTADPASPAG